MTATLSRHAGPAEIGALVRQLREVASESPATWAGLDLTFMQLRALFILQAKGALRVSDLAGALSLSLASASALADRLVRLDVVERRPDAADRRSVRLALSPQ